jgi:hypothetical protein
VKKLVTYLQEMSLANILVAGFIIVSAGVAVLVADDLIPPLPRLTVSFPRGLRFRNVSGDETFYPQTSDYLHCELGLPDRLVRAYKPDNAPHPRYVIDVEETATMYPACQFEVHAPVDRIKIDWTARLVDLRTGYVLAEETFEGTIPYATSCPEWDNVEAPPIEAFYGCPNEDEFESWVLASVLDPAANTVVQPTEQAAPLPDLPQASPASP